MDAARELFDTTKIPHANRFDSVSGGLTGRIYAVTATIAADGDSPN